MGNELIASLEFIAQERGISKDKLVAAVEKAIHNAAVKSLENEWYEMGKEPARWDVSVKLDLNSGDLKIMANVSVVAKKRAENEILLEDAKKLNPKAKIGDVIALDFTSKISQRVVAQNTRQGILQQINDAEKKNVEAEFVDKIGQLVHGIVTKIDDKRNVYVDLGKAVGFLPFRHQIRNPFGNGRNGEKFNLGDRVTALLLEIDEKMGLVLSRTDSKFVTRLFEREVSEIHDEIVKIERVERIQGSRTMIAVSSGDSRVDPVGACLGMRSFRIRSIFNELGGKERIDVIPFSKDPEAMQKVVLKGTDVSSVEWNYDRKILTLHLPEENRENRVAGQRSDRKRLPDLKLFGNFLGGWQVSQVFDARGSEAENTENSAEDFEEKKQEAVQFMSELLNIDAEQAALIVNGGYLTLAGLKNAAPDAFASIEGLREETLEAIRKALV